MKDDSTFGFWWFWDAESRVDKAHFPSFLISLLGVISDVLILLSSVLFQTTQCLGFLSLVLKCEFIYCLFYNFLGLINHIGRIDNDAHPKWVSVRDPSFSYLTKCVGGSLSRWKKQKQLKRWPSILLPNFTFLLCVDSLWLVTDHLLIWSPPMFWLLQ